MNAKSARDRWNTPAGKSVVSQIKKVLERGCSLHEVYTEKIGEKVDLRGIDISNGRIKGVSLDNVDLSYSKLVGAWIEGSKFRNIIFNGTNLSGFTDHGNLFSETTFVGCDLRRSGIGYNGTVYTKCTFERCRLKEAVFIRSEFEDCVFVNCDFSGVDFNVSSFERCKFIGRLNDVRFRGSYAFPQDQARFGGFKKSGLHNVDFSEADFSWLAITDGAPITGVVLPPSPSVFLLDRLDEVLPLARKAAFDVLSGKDYEAAKLFFDVQIQYAKNQNESIINLQDYAEPGTSDDFTEKLKKLLSMARAKFPP